MGTIRDLAAQYDVPVIELPVTDYRDRPEFLTGNLLEDILAEPDSRNADELYADGYFLGSNSRADSDCPILLNFAYYVEAYEPSGDPEEQGFSAGCVALLCGVDLSGEA